MSEENTQATPAEATTETKKQPEHILCPCCGQPTLTKPITVSTEVLDHYMACILSGVPFWRSYDIYGGKANISITMLSQAQRDMLNTLYGAIGEADRLLLDDNAYSVKLSSAVEVVRTAMYIKDLTVYNAEREIAYTATPITHACDTVVKYAKVLKQACADDDGTAAGALRAAIDDFYAAINDKNITTVFPLQVLILCVNAHIQLHEVLIGCGFDSNFWAGIELA